MNKTLLIELSDQRKAMTDSFYREMYDIKSELWLCHDGQCDWQGNPEEHCDCVMMDCYNWIKNWGAK